MSRNIPSKPLHYKVLKWSKDVYSSVRFIYHQNKERYKFGDYYLRYCQNGKCKEAYIFANGPSLNEEIKNLLNKGLDLNESIVVNSFALTEYFQIIKPSYYCLADPHYFDGRHHEISMPVFKKINEIVNWNMTLYILMYDKNTLDNIKQYIPNSYVRIKGISTLKFEGFEAKRYESYKKGVSVPSFVNVSIMGLYILLNLGYKKINLFGVDHSFLAGLSIDDDNQLCMLENHFYGKEKHRLEVIRNGHLWKMADFVYDKYLTFKEHENMRGYADFLGAEVINHTRDSWIDAYTRISQVEKSKQ